MNRVSEEPVAVIDDDREQAQAVSVLLDDAGFRSIVVSGPFIRVPDLVAAVRSNATAAICDHRLSSGGFATFLGAEAVSQLIEAGVPAVLLTQFADTDSDVSIRRWRAHIPVVMSRADADPDRLLEAIAQTKDEMDGNIPVARRAQRALLNIVGQEDVAGETTFDVFVTQWRPHTAIRLPASIIPAELRSTLTVGSVVLADVNIDAEDASELYFKKFAPAPEPARLKR